MIWNSGKILAMLATITADTKNHKEKLSDIKDTFDTHIEKEERQQIETQKKIHDIHCSVSNMKCPHDDRIEKLEEKYIKIRRDGANKLLADAEKKALEIKERAGVDKKVAEDISSLQARGKYNLLSMAGLWTLLGVILKKIFTT